MAKSMFYDLLKEEFTQTGAFVIVGQHTIDAVDTIITAELKEEVRECGWVI